MQPLSNARQLAWRGILSALAGGGLTTAALGGPVGTALAEGGGVPNVTVSESPATGAETTSTPAPTPTQTSTQPAAPPASTQPSGESSTSTTTFAPPPPPAKSSAPTGAQPPAVSLKRKQKNGKGNAGNQPAKNKSATGKANGANNVALSPALVAGQARAIAAALASSSASVQALGFYRIPLFLLPIYKAAAVQYGVPWQILAAINEIETDYGNDQSVSTAGAVGWMQFMPETWLQYGVDALNAGYADPYNPVDAVFAAARYLRAAGAASNLPEAIFSYNHSQEYVASVLLRAKLISSYPKTVIATLTGLTDGRLPVTGTHLAWNTLLSAPASPASATAGAIPLPARVPGAPASAAIGSGQGAVAAAPAASAAKAANTRPAAQTQQFAEVTGTPGASVVAVQDGRIAQIGQSARLGKFIVLRDVYGDLFTYAGLESIAKSYLPQRSPRGAVTSPTVEAASTSDPAPSKPATAGSQPLTLSVKPSRKASGDRTAAAARSLSVQANGYEATSTPGKVRLFAHPGNPDARAAAASAKRAGRVSKAGGRAVLRVGSVLATGTVLGKVRVPSGAHAGHMRFAIRPAGDSNTIDPRPILTNWAELGLALHPQGAKATNPLLGATAGDVLLLSRSELERAVLSDPSITLDACGRHEVASGRMDRRVLAVLAYLSHSGLKPTASVLGCSAGAAQLSGSAAARAGAEVDITAVNGIAIAGHQGAGTITDLTIRTLLTLPEQFAPHTIASLMHYPGTHNTHAAPSYSTRVRIAFEPAVGALAPSHASAGAAARSARAALSTSPFAAPTFVSASQWEQLMSRVSALPVPSVQTKRSAAAVPDPKHR